MNASVVKTDEDLDTLRHDTAHLLAQSVKELYPDAQVAIGPAIENGFYYDFAFAEPLSTDALPLIEQRMREIVERADSYHPRRMDAGSSHGLFQSVPRAFQSGFNSAYSRA
jgi:threonyl-tRNA synthetase